MLVAVEIGVHLLGEVGFAAIAGRGLLLLPHPISKSPNLLALKVWSAAYDFVGNLHELVVSVRLLLLLHQAIPVAGVDHILELKVPVLDFLLHGV